MINVDGELRLSNEAKQMIGNARIFDNDHLFIPQIQVATDTGGVKHDHGKDPWHLAPWDSFKAVVHVLAFGATKYGDRNWEKGMDWSRLFGATMRHLAAWWNGEAKDPETGYSHLWHASTCVLFLVAYELRGIGTDDRPKMVPSRHNAN